jgi:hypothetical protein
VAKDLLSQRGKYGEDTIVNSKVSKVSKVSSAVLLRPLEMNPPPSSRLSLSLSRCRDILHTHDQVARANSQESWGGGITIVFVAC